MMTKTKTKSEVTAAIAPITSLVEHGSYSHTQWTILMVVNDLPTFAQFMQDPRYVMTLLDANLPSTKFILDEKGRVVRYQSKEDAFSGAEGLEADYIVTLEENPKTLDVISACYKKWQRTSYSSAHKKKMANGKLPS